MGGGLATWAIATDALGADLAALRAAGSDLGDPIAGERRRADGAVASWRLATPRLLGPSEPPFLIEHDSASAEWTPAGRAARLALAHPLGGSVRLEALELAVDEVSPTLQRFARTAGLRFRPSLTGGGSRDADVGGQIVRLRPRRGGSGSAVIRLAAPVPEERVVELLGCRWVVRPAPAATRLSVGRRSLRSPRPRRGHSKRGLGATQSSAPRCASRSPRSSEPSATWRPDAGRRHPLRVRVAGPGAAVRRRQARRPGPPAGHASARRPDDGRRRPPPRD
jgi:hypothetical protein